MTPAEEILHGTDWSALEHAYDAAADLPDLLRGPLSGDPDVAGDVLDVLDVSIDIQVGWLALLSHRAQRRRSICLPC